MEGGGEGDMNPMREKKRFLFCQIVGHEPNEGKKRFLFCQIVGHEGTQ